MTKTSEASNIRARTAPTGRRRNRLKQSAGNSRQGGNNPYPRSQSLKTEQAKELIEKQLESLGNALEAGQSETLQTFLSAMARFHKYRFGNVLLIMAQSPEATHVAGFQTWKSFGRFVKPGEKGIAILAPMVFKSEGDDAAAKTSQEGQESDDAHVRFRVVHVFDVSQTDGAPLPEFAKVSGEPGDFAERLKCLTRQLSIELEYSDQLGGAFGVSKGGIIVLREGLDPAQEFTTLVHELAHEILHHGEGRQGTTKRSRELQAEAVAYVVAEAIGLDSGTASSDYIQLYHGDKDLLSASLDAVRKAAGIILDGIS